MSYRILNNLVLFDILVALFPIVQMNQHVGEIVIKLKALLLLKLLHLLDLLLLLDGHMWHLIIHCLLIVLLINLLRVLVLGVNSLIYHSFLFDVIFKVFILVFLADILIEVIFVIRFIFIIFICCGRRLRLRLLMISPIIDPERGLNSHHLSILLINLIGMRVIKNLLWISRLGFLSFT